MGTPDPRWFPRFADIPGVAYETPDGVDVARLRHRHDRPEVHRFPDHPELGPSLWWGNSSRAPAGGHGLDDPGAATTARVLRNLAEALELPGEPSDYHFAIQNVVDLLWGRRTTEPAVFTDIDRLCWLDLQLIDACPDAISYEHRDGGMQYFRVTIIERLLTLCLTEGALTDAGRALQIAERRGNGDTPSANRARERCAAFAAEDQHG